MQGSVNSTGNIASGAATAYGYDNLNRLTAVKYNYQSPVWPAATIDSSGGKVVDSTGSGVADSSGASVTYAYDGASNLRTHMRDASGDSYYSYDSQGRLVSYTPPVGLAAGNEMWYAYNNAGQKTRVSIASGLDTSGNPVNATYDVIHDYYANGWLQDVKYNSNTIAQYSYDSAGNRTGIAYPNGVSTSYVYDNDPRYRLISITDSGANMAAFQISYTVDSVGNPLSMTDSTGSSTLPWSYSYDANNRLTSATAPNPVPSQPAGGSYGYDWVGNRLHPPADPNPMIYNAADQLTSWPGMHGYQYDSAGNLVTVTGAGTATYTYTPAGLLNTATYSIVSGAGNHTLTNTMGRGFQPSGLLDFANGQDDCSSTT